MFAKTNLKAGAVSDTESFIKNLQKNLDRMQHNPETVQWNEIMSALGKVQERRLLAASKRMSNEEVYNLHMAVDSILRVRHEEIIAELYHNRKCFQWIQRLKAEGITPQDLGAPEGAVWKTITFW